MSNAYYDKHGHDFVRATINLDTGTLYAPFLKLLPAAAHILDAGCGSGRDTKIFTELGYTVTAIDASAEMVALAREFTGMTIEHLSFQKLDYEDVFDGIWACASLLHVPEQEMDDVIRRLTRALKDDGVLYMSFKHGEREESRNGRMFNDYSEDKLNRRLSAHPELHLIKVWITPDIRPGRSNEHWLNALMRKEL